MTLRLHPDLIAAGYDFLRQSQPFKGWRLPEADEIGFHVVRDPNKSADFGVENGIPFIRISERNNGHTGTLLMTIAHEATHLHQYLRKLDRGGHHNADFWRRAKKICAIHGWDEAIF